MGDLVNEKPLNEAGIKQSFEEKIASEITTKRILVGVGATIGLAVLLPVAFMAAQTGMYLAVVGGFVLIGGVVYKKLPGWQFRLENSIREENQKEMNRHLAALQAEAKKNPIEQALSNYIERSNQYNSFKKAIQEIGGLVESFKNKLEKTKKEKPNYDLSNESRALEKMTEFYESRKNRLEEAYKTLCLFHEKIDEAKTKWEFQLKANEAIRAMNNADKDAKINEILTDIAFDTIQEEFDSIFAKLDVDAVEINAQKSLSFGNGITLDTSEIEIPVKTPA